MKRIISATLALILLLTLSLSLFSCADNKGEIKINPDKAHYVVGICQQNDHEALDDATMGFKEALSAALAAEGRTVEFKYQSAQGETSNMSTIIAGFIASDVDMIVANGTAVLAAAYSATSTIPIVGTSITEYGVALGIEGFDGTVGANVTGVSDLAPITQQADVMIETLDLNPGNKVGLLFCSAEPNSLYQIKVIEEYFASKSIDTERFSFSDSNDISAVTGRAAGSSDAIYIPTDNTAVSNAQTIYNVASPIGIPVFVADTGSCGICGFATLSSGYYNIGVKAGKIAAEILLGKADITKMPIAYDDAPEKFYNKYICEELGIDIAALEAKGFSMLEGTSTAP